MLFSVGRVNFDGQGYVGSVEIIAHPMLSGRHSEWQWLTITCFIFLHRESRWLTLWDMAECEFCGKQRPENRVKFCSTKCSNNFRKRKSRQGRQQVLLRSCFRCDAMGRRMSNWQDCKPNFALQRWLNQSTAIIKECCCRDAQLPLKGNPRSPYLILPSIVHCLIGVNGNDSESWAPAWSNTKATGRGNSLNRLVVDFSHHISMQENKKLLARIAEVEKEAQVSNLTYSIVHCIIGETRIDVEICAPGKSSSRQ